MYNLHLTRDDANIKTTGFGDQCRDLLFLTLETSVRLRLMEQNFGNWDVFKARQEYLIKMLCEKGDLILFRSDKKGESTKAFNALAEALSYLTLVPGGVRFLGWTWISQKEGKNRDGEGTELDLAIKISLKKNQLQQGFAKVQI